MIVLYCFTSPFKLDADADIILASHWLDQKNRQDTFLILFELLWLHKDHNCTLLHVWYRSMPWGQHTCQDILWQWMGAGLCYCIPAITRCRLMSELTLLLSACSAGCPSLDSWCLAAAGLFQSRESSTKWCANLSLECHGPFHMYKLLQLLSIVITCYHIVVVGWSSRVKCLQDTWTNFSNCKICCSLRTGKSRRPWLWKGSFCWPKKSAASGFVTVHDFELI